MTIQDLLNQENTVIVDVRSPEEFASGHVEGSINIPLNEVLDRQDEFKNINGDIIVCCLSGGRSGMAEMMLKQIGIENVYNGGGWTEVAAAKIK